MLSLEIHTYVSCICSIALCGGETWSLRKICQKNPERCMVLVKVGDQLVKNKVNNIWKIR